MIDIDALLEHAPNEAFHRWLSQSRQRFELPELTRNHGDAARWQQALSELPVLEASEVDLQQRVGVMQNPPLSQSQTQLLAKALQGLKPWRKGPFHLHGVHIDTEWRSDWKWDRVNPHLSDLHQRRVLDVGCGSGYHCWRILGSGARCVVGIDPSLLFLYQFTAVKKLLGAHLPVWQLPIPLEDLPTGLKAFDTVFSMGVLYHRRSPIEHLLALKDCLAPGGELVLETLVVEGDENTTFLPQDRYARMRNVWFLPSPSALCHWLDRLGFEKPRLVDLNQTTIEEQRQTDWMPYESLAQCLDLKNPGRTIEGYPAPLRATILANKAT